MKIIIVADDFIPSHIAKVLLVLIFIKLINSHFYKLQSVNSISQTETEKLKPKAKTENKKETLGRIITQYKRLYKEGKFRNSDNKKVYRQYIIIIN